MIWIRAPVLGTLRPAAPATRAFAAFSCDTSSTLGSPTASFINRVQSRKNAIQSKETSAYLAATVGRDGPAMTASIFSIRFETKPRVKHSDFSDH